MSWEIRGKDGAIKTVVGSLEYNGEWMQECYVTVTIESPMPINFLIGDYIVYRGERFEINYDPGKIKCAEPYQRGDAFRYENVKFNSLADELTRCDFLDVVLGDNQLHFTGLPKFSFYGGVRDLADRIQANLDRAYPNMWTVIVSPEFSGDAELNISVDAMKVSGVLADVLVNKFKTYYTVKGRTLTIGAAGVPADHLFKYGKGEGLYEIEQNAEADQQIVTRLRAYGSTRNLPHRYYNSLTRADGEKMIPDNMAVQYLMLPSFPYTTQDPYIDSYNIPFIGVREGTIFFDGSQDGLPEIYPSIEGMTAEELKAAGVSCNATGDLDVLVSAEQVTDNGVGVVEGNETKPADGKETFKVTLKDLGFDINDHLTTETAVISFKSGKLGGRDFEIVECGAIKNSDEQITGYELELNRVYDDDVKLWFPYNDYNAEAGDKFVLLSIDMPEAYIKAASQRLLKAALEWLANNDYSRSIYAPKIDEIFMARQHDAALASNGTIKSLHDSLKEGMQLLFEDKDLGIDAAIFIDRLTIVEGEGQIPTYEVVLKEEKTVGRLDKIQNQIDSLSSGQGAGGYNAAQIRSLISAYGSAMFLSKLKDDRSKGKIASDKGLEVGKYLAGVSGAIIGKDAETGQTFGEMDRLFIRIKAYFETLTIINAEALAGKQYITPGGGVKCTSVDEYREIEVVKERPKTDGDGNPVLDADGNPVMEEYTEMVSNGIPEDVYRCYFLSEQDGEKTETKIIAGDQVTARIFNAKPGTSNKVSNHRFWRLAMAVNNDAYTDENGNHYGYIDLSKTDCEKGSDVPQAYDELVQFGNRNDRTRQAAMVFSTVDADAPSIKLLTGINSYTLVDKEIIAYGYDPVKGNAYFRCYGDHYVGAPDGSTFVRYDEQGKQIDLHNVRLSVDSTIGDKRLDDYFASLIDLALSDFIAGYQTTIGEIKTQVDGKAQTWYQSTDPATAWTTAAVKAEHVGDLWYCSADIAGTQYKKGTTWYWDGSAWQEQPIPQSVFDTIDGKANIYVVKPTTGYHKNDLWFLESEYTLSDGKHAVGTLVVALRDMGSAWSANDWAKKDRYTDDTLANQALDKIAKIDYLATAFKQKTTIEGGVVLSSIVSLGVNNDDFTTQTTYSGISGIYDATKRGSGIAAWYGGDMVDAFDYYNAATGQFSIPAGIRAAASLFRMDGTGYLSKGSLWWDAAGNLFLGSGVTIGGESGGATLASMLNAISGFSSLLVPIDKDGNELDWKNAASAVALKARKNFCSAGDIVALGWQESSGGSTIGVSALADLTDVKLTGLANGDLIQWNGTKWVNVKASALGIGGNVDLSAYLKVNGSNGTASGVSALIRALGSASAAVKDETLIITSDINGQTDAYPNYYRRQAPSFWEYIKGKSDSRYVTLDTAQTIMGAKTFATAIIAKEIQITGTASATGSWIKSDSSENIFFQANGKSLLVLNEANNAVRSANALAGTISLGTSATPWNNVYANKFIKSGGTSAQFLKADGSVDGNSYVRKIANTHSNISPTAYIKIGTLPTSSNVTLDSITIDGFIGAFHAPSRSCFSVVIGRRDGLRFHGWYQGGGESYMNLGVNSNGEVYLICYNQYVTYSLSVKSVGATIDYTGNVSTPKDTSWTLLSTVSGMARLGTSIVLDTSNYTSTLDSRYVKKSGDEMAGKLSIKRDASEDFGGYVNGLLYLSSVGVKPYIHIGYNPMGKNNGANIGFCYKGNQSTSNYLFLGFTSNNELMTLTAAGNVGIGTTSPLDKLHLHSNGAIIRISNESNNGFSLLSSKSLGFCSSTTSGFDFTIYALTNSRNIMGIIGGAYGASANTLSYLYYGGVSATDPAMVILPDKKVGINKTNPAYALDVNGTIYATNAITCSYIGMSNSATNPYLVMVLNNRRWYVQLSQDRMYLGEGSTKSVYIDGNGNLFSPGDQVAASSSDRRLKMRFATIDYMARILRLGAVTDYEWSDKARALDPGKYDGVRHSSVVWQRARKVGIPGFCGIDEYGYGYVNWLNKDYQASLLGAVQQTIRAVRRHDEEIRRLRRRVAELEGMVYNNKCA